MGKKWISFFECSSKTPLRSKDEFIGGVKTLLSTIDDAASEIIVEINTILNSPERITLYLGRRERYKICTTNIALIGFHVMRFLGRCLFFLFILSLIDNTCPFLDSVIYCCRWAAVLFFVLLPIFTVIIDYSLLSRLREKELLITDLQKLKKINDRLTLQKIPHPNLKELVESDIFERMNEKLISIKGLPANTPLSHIPDKIENAYQQVILTIAEADYNFQNGDDIYRLIPSFSHGIS